MPRTCAGCEGFVEVRFDVVMTFCPPMYMGYSRPNSEATFFNASSMALRFSGFDKSTKGSFVNSVMWIFASAVAMAGFLLDRQTRDCTARAEFATSWVDGTRDVPRGRNRRRARRAVPLRS